MGSPFIYSGGIGGTSGDELASFTNLYTSGNVWYVSSTTGADAAAPAGLDRIKPLRTLAQAVTNCAIGDIIVFLSGHSEVLTSSQVINKAGVRLISEGAAGTANAAHFTCNGNVVMWDLQGAGIWVGGVYFAASTVAPNLARVRISGVGTVVRGCYFESGSLDSVPALQYIAGSGQALVRNCTFISTATATATQPGTPLIVQGAMSDFTMDTVTFNGGLSGWSARTAFAAQSAVTRCTATNIDLLNDSDVNMVTGGIYTWSIRNKSGSARVILDA